MGYRKSQGHIKMKKAIISGGTGLIGSHLVTELNTIGYTIDIISRNKPREPYFYPKGVEKYIYYEDFLFGKNVIIDDYDIAINLAGATIAGKKWTEDYKKIITSSRVDTTNAFAELIVGSNNPPKVFISASAVGYYGDAGNLLLTEDIPEGEGFLAEVCKSWETEAKATSETTRTVIARIGVVLSSRGGALEKLAMPYRYFLGGPIGSGEQWISWIHIRDLMSMFLFVIDNEECTGTFNFTAPEPVKMNDFSEDLGDVLYRPSFFKLPNAALKFMLGESSEMLLASQRAVSKAALDKGFIFKFPELKPALKDLLR